MKPRYLIIAFLFVLQSFALAQRLPIPGNMEDDLASATPGWKYPTAANGITPAKATTCINSVTVAKQKVIDLIATGTLDDKDKKEMERTKKVLCNSVLWLYCPKGGGSDASVIPGARDMAFSIDMWCNGVPYGTLYHESSHNTDLAYFEKKGFRLKVHGHWYDRISRELLANRRAKRTLDLLYSKSIITLSEYIDGLQDVLGSLDAYISKTKSRLAKWKKLNSTEKDKMQAMLSQLEDLGADVDACLQVYLQNWFPTLEWK